MRALPARIPDNTRLGHGRRKHVRDDLAERAAILNGLIKGVPFMLSAAKDLLFLVGNKQKQIPRSALQ